MNVLSQIALFVIFPLICVAGFVYVVTHGGTEEVSLTDEQARSVNDAMPRMIQEQEADRLLLIEKQDKDVELDKED